MYVENSAVAERMIIQLTIKTNISLSTSRGPDSTPARQAAWTRTASLSSAVGRPSKRYLEAPMERSIILSVMGLPIN